MNKYLIVLVISALIILSGCFNNETENSNQQISEEQTTIDTIAENIDLLEKLSLSTADVNKLVKNEDGDIYYIMDTGDRYIFPTHDIYKTWFPDIETETISTKTIEELYGTRLRGNVFIKPTTLIQTETDPKVYFVDMKGKIKEVQNLNLLPKLYGDRWEQQIVHVENKYFTNYTYDTPITSIDDIPSISTTLTIEQNQ